MLIVSQKKKNPQLYIINPSYAVFSKWSRPGSHLEVSIYSTRDNSLKIIFRMANNANFDEPAHYELAHQNLHCLQNQAMSPLA